MVCNWPQRRGGPEVSPQEEQPLLTVEQLSVSFVTESGSVNSVEDVSFDIRPGETVVVVGESGSGKSVTSLAIMGLLPKGLTWVSARAMQFRRRDGTVVSLGAANEADMRTICGNEIAMIFQEPMTSLNPVFTIGHQIVEAIRAHETVRGREARNRACRLLSELGIADPSERMQSYPHQLSGGMRQRVMIAIALACRPTLLIADEPTTALDVTIQAQIVQIMREMQRKRPMAILFITHNLGLAAEIADRIVVMYAGRMVEEGSTSDIFLRPRMPYTMALLASIPRLGSYADSQQDLPVIVGSVPSPGEAPPGCSFHPRCSHFQPVTCDTAPPDYETCGPAHRVRCARWRELGHSGGGTRAEWDPSSKFQN